MNNAHQYRLERRVGASGSWTNVEPDTGGTSKTATGLVCDPPTTYSFRVRARGDGSPYSMLFGRASGIVSWTTPNCGDSLGLVGLTEPLPRWVGETFIATLFDPDGVVTVSEMWQWQRSPNGNTNWSDIPGATRNTYTVTDDDLGKWLRATVAYTDGHGPGKSAESVTVPIPPPAPTDLRINGNLVNGKVTLRWEPVSGAASYEVQYALDIFPAIGPLVWMTPDDDDISITDPTIGGKTVKEATLGSLTAGRLYQVRVRATDTGAVSQWSDFVVVHPTAAPYTDGMDTEIATIGLFAYQPNGVFDYVICNPPAAYTDATSALIPVTFQTLPNQDYVGYIDTAVKDWDNFVKWDVGGGTNIIQTVDRGAITECRHPAIWVPETMPPPDQIIFVDDYDMGLLCQDSELLGCVRQPGPSAVEAQELPETIEAAPYFSILFTSQPESPSYPQSKWSDLGAKGCTRFHNVAVHEVGHAFGLHHQGNTDTSRRVIMTGYRYTPEGQHCDPTPYDVIAMMANYQSVPRSP